jgi:hypothetical protein
MNPTLTAHTPTVAFVASVNLSASSVEASDFASTRPNPPSPRSFLTPHACAQATCALSLTAACQLPAGMRRAASPTSLPPGGPPAHLPSGSCRSVFRVAGPGHYLSFVRSRADVGYDRSPGGAVVARRPERNEAIYLHCRHSKISTSASTMSSPSDCLLRDRSDATDPELPSSVSESGR